MESDVEAGVPAGRRLGYGQQRIVAHRMDYGAVPRSHSYAWYHAAIRVKGNSDSAKEEFIVLSEGDAKSLSGWTRKEPEPLSDDFCFCRCRCIAEV
jgi:hypothetical protein